ncbi:MAG TPA: patatin-like phospholipase family protein [Longimicrobium sp.]|nr:patatin-like phospholipase family protein [Longimicrobium sp.]
MPALPRSLRLRALAAALPLLAIHAVSAAAQAAVAASPPVPAPAADTVPVVLTISGGISLGSYQSGVNWALVNVFRHSYHSPGFRAQYGLPAYRLAVATGASAGNINAVLSTLDWCAEYQPTSAPAERSLLWKAWIGMGIRELFPNDRTSRRPPAANSPSGYGLFRRDQFQNLYRDEIETRFASDRNTGCSVAVGMTLTRIAPDSIRLNDQIWPRAQRFASAFTIRTPPGEGPRQLQIASAPRAARHDPAFGRMVAPPPGADGTVKSAFILRLVEASSAFPLAFEPVYVRYYPPDSVSADGACPSAAPGRCAPPAAESFMDGGVFDNNPLGLALGLYRHTRPGAPAEEHYIYINPDRIRSPALLARASHPDSSRLEGRGLAAVSGLLGGAVPAARQYELHSLARTLDDSLRRRIHVTDRGHALVSSHLGAFAGFLGQPFREFDFYAGMYDGLYYAAHDLVCRRFKDDAGMLRACTRDRLGELLGDDRLALSATARAVLARLYREEFPEAARPAPPAPAGREARLLVAIDSALHAAAADTACGRVGSPVARALCRDGFTTFVQKLRTPQVMALTVEWRGSPGCAASDGDCRVDPEMNALLRDPERYVARLASRVVDRVDNVERGLGRPGSHRAVTLAGAVYHLGAGEPRRGMEKDPSSVPDTRGTWWRVVSHGLPYYVGFGTGGGIEAGYRPSYYLGNGAAVVFPVLPLYFSPTRDPQRDQYYAGYGAGLHLRAFRALDVEGSYQALRPYDSPLGAPVSTAEGALILVEKLRVGVRYVFSDPASVYPGARGLRVDGLSLTVGLLDANGLVYWTGRLLAH